MWDPLKLREVRKIGRHGGEFDLVFGDGTVAHLGTAANVLLPSRVQAAIADATTVTIPDFKRAAWHNFGATIIAAAGPGEDLETGPAAKMRSWLESFTSGVNRKTFTVLDTAALAAKLRSLMALPAVSAYKRAGFFWMATGELCVHIPSLLRWLTFDFGVRTSEEEVKQGLSYLGFHPKRPKARDSTGVAQLRMWVSAPGFGVEADTADDA